MIKSIRAKRLTCDVCGHERIIDLTEDLPKRCANKKCQSTLWNRKKNANSSSTKAA